MFLVSLTVAITCNYSGVNGVAEETQSAPELTKPALQDVHVFASLQVEHLTGHFWQPEEVE